MSSGKRPSSLIEPWYVAYAILGALASGTAVISIPLLITRYGGTAAQIGIAIAAQNLGALFAPLWGWVADRSRDYRPVFLGGFILIAAGFSAFPAVKEAPLWFLSAFLIGFGTGASNTVACLFVVEFFSPPEWAKRISWLDTFNAIGALLGVALAGFLSPQWGMVSSALLVIPALLIGGWGLPVPKEPIRVPHLRLERGELDSLIRHVEPLTNSITIRLHTLRITELSTLVRDLSRPFCIFLATWFFFALACSGFYSLYPILLQRSFNVKASTSALILSFATAISVPLYGLAGRFITKRGAASVLNFGIVVRLIGFAALWLLAVLHSPLVLIPVACLVIMLQGMWPLLSVASNELSAKLPNFGKGAAIGLFSSVGAIATGMGAIGGGIVADHFGYASVTLFVSLGLALALSFSRRLARL